MTTQEVGVYEDRESKDPFSQGHNPFYSSVVNSLCSCSSPVTLRDNPCGGGQI